MIYGHRLAQDRTLVRVLLLALALTALLSILLLFASPRSATALTSPTADYRFQDTRSSSIGTAPALVDICDASPTGPCTGTNANTFTTDTVDGTSRRVLRFFPQGNGLKLSPTSSATSSVVPNGTYTIEVQVKFDSVSGYQRILDFKNGTSDNGLYVDNGNLEFFRATPMSGVGVPITANKYVDVTLTRNFDGTVAGYVDGELQFFFDDSTSNDAVIDTNKVLRFFRDNESGGATDEDSTGSVARIRLYNEALPTAFTINSTGDQNDLDFPSGSWNQSGDGRCDVDAVTAGSQCTLRAAIQQSDLARGADTITFDIPGTGLHTISPNSALPPVYGAATVDGYSQPGATPNSLAVGDNAAPKIELRGANAGTAVGLDIRGWNNVVRGLIINGWAKNAIEVTRANDNVIEGNFIGTDVTGTQITQPRNSGYGIWLHGASNNVVGGTTPAARNVISGNGVQGIYISRYVDTATSPKTDVDARDNKIQGNYIGTDKNGTTALGNGASGYQTANGVWIDGASHNVVGGTEAGAGNLISGNAGSGVQIGSGVADTQATFNIDGPSYNTVQGNYIGTDATGTWDLGNGGVGVDITENNFSSFVAGHNIVGGTTPASRNVISCNYAGVDISFDHQKNNEIQGNYIGTDVTGTLDRGNRSWGVEIFGSPDNVVGGTDAGSGNLITRNDGPGVFLDAPGGNTMFPTGNRLLRNAIFNNDKPSFDGRELGIDLDGGTQSPEGVTLNDTGDADTGPNGLQNYPVITSAVTSGGHTTIKGTINTTANDRLTIQLFRSSAADPSGFGEGETYIGDARDVDGDSVVNTDIDGNAKFSYVTSKPLAAGQVVTATATSTFSRGTSEFSEAKEVNTAPTVTNLKPASGSKTRDRTPLIAATVSDAQTDLAKSDIKFFVDGKSKNTFSYDASKDRLSYTSGRLSFAKHTVKIVATDGVLSTTKTWSFKVVM